MIYFAKLAKANFFCLWLVLVGSVRHVRVELVVSPSPLYPTSSRSGDWVSDPVKRQGSGFPDEEAQEEELGWGWGWGWGPGRLACTLWARSIGSGAQPRQGGRSQAHEVAPLHPLCVHPHTKMPTQTSIHFINTSFCYYIIYIYMYIQLYSNLGNLKCLPYNKLERFLFTPTRQKKKKNDYLVNSIRFIFLKIFNYNK